LRSIRFFNRARPSSERGYALVVAIVLAVLYFGLVELMLIDSSRELSEARRFRARVIAETLAENAAELAALQLVTRQATPPFNVDSEQGAMRGSMTKPGEGFEIRGEGVSAGVTESRASVILRGRIDKGVVKIQYTWHQ
jgi:hypothetical protein